MEEWEQNAIANSATPNGLGEKRQEPKGNGNKFEAGRFLELTLHNNVSLLWLDLT